MHDRGRGRAPDLLGALGPRDGAGRRARLRRCRARQRRRRSSATPAGRASTSASSAAAQVVSTRETWLGEPFTGHLTGLSVGRRALHRRRRRLDRLGRRRRPAARRARRAPGADPGPACYGRGGDAADRHRRGARCSATSTRTTSSAADARSTSTRPRAAIATLAARSAIGARAGGAARIIAVANEHMVAAIKEITVNQGVDPRESVLVAGGGAAGLNIVPIARELGCRRVLRAAQPRRAERVRRPARRHRQRGRRAACSPTPSRSRSPSVGAGARRGRRAARRRSARRSPAAARRRRDRATSSRRATPYQVWDLEIPLAASGSRRRPTSTALSRASTHRTSASSRSRARPADRVRLLEGPPGRGAADAAARRARRRRRDAEPRRLAERTAYFPGAGAVDDAGLQRRLARRPAHRLDRPGADRRADDDRRSSARRRGCTVDRARRLPAGARDEPSSAERRHRGSGSVDPVLLAVLANRFDVDRPRDDQHPVPHRRARRCSTWRATSPARIVTADNQLLAAAEGLQVHVLGAGLQTRVDARAARRRPRRGRRVPPQRPLPRQHPHRRPHDPVPVFVDGRARLHRLAKAHQADCGNSAADHLHAATRGTSTRRAGSSSPACGSSATTATSTTSSACAGAGSACRSSGTATTWRRSARRASASGGSRELVDAVRARDDRGVRRRVARLLASGGWARRSRSCPRPGSRRPRHHDPMPGPARRRRRSTSRSTIEPDAGRIEVDLRDNIDCVRPRHQPVSSARRMAGAMIGVFNCLDADIPHNAGSFRRVDVLHPRGLRRRRAASSRTRARWRRRTSSTG